MAGGNYRSCDLCGSKTFYDAELSYDYEGREGRPFVRDSEYNLGSLGDWACICIDCAKTHRVVIEKIDAAMQQPDDAKQRLLEIMRRNGLATGHGDTLKQVIDTLEVELTDTLAAMCEWTRHGFGRTYDTACKSGYVRFVTRPDVWKFCPNCGKKIRFIDGDNNGTL